MPQERLRIVAPFPFSGDRLHAAVDLRARPPGPVVLALWPRLVVDDPARLARLAAEVERAAHLHHPNVLAPAGLEPLGDRLAATAAWRDVVTVRELLEAGGRLPPDVAVRIAIDACAGLEHAHARPEPVVHGAVRPEAVLVGTDGVAVVSGFGVPGDATAADDVRAVAAVLHECVAGEPPAEPARPLDAPGVPAPLAAAVDRALAPDPAARFPSAAALAAALEAALPPADRAAVAAYAEAIVPSDEGARAERRRLLEEAVAAASRAAPGGAEEISEDAILGAALTPPVGAGAAPVAPEPAAVAAAVAQEARSVPPAATSNPTSTATSTSTSTPTPTPTPTATATPTTIATANPVANPIATANRAPTASATATARDAHPERTRAGELHPPEPAREMPLPPPPRSRAPLAVALAMGVAGLALGLWLSRLGGGPAAAPATAEEGPAAAVAAAPAPAPAPDADAPPAGERDAAASSEMPPLRVEAAPRPPAHPSISIAPQPPGEVWVDGRKVGRAGATIPVARGLRTVRLRDPARWLDVRKRVEVRGAGTPVRFDVGRGVLDVTAPDGAQVLVDGRAAGRGTVHVELYEGDHRVDVTLGGAKVGESFHLGAGESYTYAVTPTVK